MRKTWLLSLVLIAACEKPAATAVEPAAPTKPESAAPAPTSQPALAPAAPSGPPAAGGLTWDAAKPFVRRAPKNAMRAAEYVLEGEERAELSVFYFGPDQGDVVEPNVTRWLGQLKQADGSDTTAKAKRSTTTSASGIKVSLVEAQGTFSGGMNMPGAPAPAPIEDAKLLGAIATGPQGSIFFKLVGPRAAVEQAGEAFQEMLRTVRPQ